MKAQSLSSAAPSPRHWRCSASALSIVAEVEHLYAIGLAVLLAVGETQAQAPRSPACCCYVSTRGQHAGFLWPKLALTCARGPAMLVR
eukprot:13610241-Alexandrium_andersonii.AAC.1